MENKTEMLLEKILEELSLLSVSIKAESLCSFNSEFLNTDNRKKMYELFDGVNDAKSISEQIGCTKRGVNMFIQDLISKDLINFHKNGNSIIPEKSVSKIAVYYSTKKLNMEGIDE